jgi:hypothetical protein
MSRKEQPTVTRPVVTAAEPQLFVADLAASCEFFTQQLGFEIRRTCGLIPASFSQQLLR